MINFNLYNPTNLCFGRDAHEQLATLIPSGSKVLMTYGGGSIKSNGTYDKVIAALSSFEVVEFGGIEPNPDFDTLSRAVDIIKTQNITFLLAVGGGSVIDGTKFLSSAALYEQRCGNQPPSYWSKTRHGRARFIPSVFHL